MNNNSNSWISKNSVGLAIGKLRFAIWFRYLRLSEIRWMGNKRQWVLSPIQVAYWNEMEAYKPNWVFSFYPMKRTEEQSILQHGGTVE